MIPLSRLIEQLLGIGALVLLAIGCALVLWPFLSEIMWAAVICFSTWPIYRRCERAVGGIRDRQRWRLQALGRRRDTYTANSLARSQPVGSGGHGRATPQALSRWMLLDGERAAVKQSCVPDEECDMATFVATNPEAYVAYVGRGSQRLAPAFCASPVFQPTSEF